MIVQSMSCVIMSKMWYIKHCYVDCRKSIYAFIFMKDLTYDLRYDLTDLGSEAQSGFEIWLNDLNTFLIRYEMRFA